MTLGGRLHDIVPKLNRTLNPKSPWCGYVMDAFGQEDPQPSDSYDGANVGENRSWGVVDDTCDGIIEVQVAINGSPRRHRTCSLELSRLRARSTAIQFAGRRPVGSRQGRVVIRTDDDLKEVQAEIADLFERVFETSSLMNLDALRDRAIAENMSEAYPVDSPPHIDEKSMTAKDQPYADELADVFPTLPLRLLPVRSRRRCLMRTWRISGTGHFATRIRSLISSAPMRTASRPDPSALRPFRRAGRPEEEEQIRTSIRDPATLRGRLPRYHMPPYMRDSDQSLSITYRQYHALMDLIDRIAAAPP